MQNLQYSFVCSHLKYFSGEEIDIDKQGRDENDMHDEGREEGGQADHDQLLRVLWAPDIGRGEEPNVGPGAETWGGDNHHDAGNEARGEAHGDETGQTAPVRDRRE